MARSTEGEALLRRLLAAIEPRLPAAIELRRRLHEHPELAHEEQWTAATIAEELPVASVAAAGTGRIARVGPDAGPAVAVRAELDGLPVAERTGATFAAAGERMHACGHDVHMAALVALAGAAHALGDELPVGLLAVFQPSEEAYPSGALQLARGELARLAPAVVVGAHVHPELAWGEVALDPGAVNASSDSVEIVFEGEPSHGAYPHRGRDPVLALAQAVVALHAQAHRRIDPLRGAVVNVGVLEAGSFENVVPTRARARASLRALEPEDRRTLRELVGEVVAGVAAAHGCRGGVELIEGEPALVNDPDLASAGRRLLREAGLSPASVPWRSCGSDDFAFFGELAPLAMAFVGLHGSEGFTPRPLHHPELLVPDAAVGAVARTLAALYVAALIS
ncbi:MAG TPA: M20 family metallopeptidase [Solirubrobacteraceae bacterium]|nr:M20 family metallopeptidase [Solirubrobacteraceae bacterium]